MCLTPKMVIRNCLWKQGWKTIPREKPFRWYRILRKCFWKRKNRKHISKKLRENLTAWIWGFHLPWQFWRAVFPWLCDNSLPLWSLKTDFVPCVFMTWDIRVPVSCLRMMFRWKRFRNGSVIQTTQSQRTSTVTLNTMLRSSLRKQLWEYLTVNQSSRKFLLTTEFATKRISGRKSKSNTPKVRWILIVNIIQYNFEKWIVRKREQKKSDFGRKVGR